MFKVDKLDINLVSNVESIIYKDNIVIGNSIGNLLFVDDNLRVETHKCFRRNFDYLESEDIRETVLAVEKLNKNCGSMKYNKYFVANERIIKLLDYKDKYYNEVFTKTCHNYIINSLSINQSNEYLLSSDMLSILLWRVDRKEYFKLIDIKSNIKEGDISVINYSQFSPFNENIFGYCFSDGRIKFNDINLSPKSDVIFNHKISEGTYKSVCGFVFLK